jgi:hypothetical protein
VKDDLRAFAWQIECDNSLVITLAVCDRWMLMLSDAADRVSPGWRLGTYVNAEEAQRRAVEMTASYERHRFGIVGPYTELTFPAKQWRTVTSGEDIDSRITDAILEALSPGVSPVYD